MNRTKVIKKESIQRNAYVLTVDENSERATLAKSVLERIGFNVILFEAIKDEFPMKSHRKSMYAIYEKIIEEEKNKYCYVFEDDINITKEVDLKYLTEYETTGEDIYYLGFCYNKGKIIKQETKIHDEHLCRIRGGVRGIHSLCMTKRGAEILKGLYDSNPKMNHMDVLLEGYTKTNPLIIIGRNLRSPCHSGHFGIFYQDRKRFKSELDGCHYYNLKNNK